MDKRARKISQLDPGDAWASIEGEGETAVVTFGSCTGPVREALAGERVKIVSLRLLSPRSPQAEESARGVKRVIVVEQNHSGQFLRYLRSEYELPGEVKSLRRPGPLPFRPEEIGQPYERPPRPHAAPRQGLQVRLQAGWCPGCGDYSVLSAVTKALAMLELRPENVAVVSGIGCSSRIPAYTTCYGFHGVHGRSLPAATGLKVARPDLTVLVASGDGDGYSIGGNHFLHACRRNVDLTYIVMDNHVYGMTRASPRPPPSPTGPRSSRPAAPGCASSIPGDRARLGANFIARAFGDRTAAPPDRRGGAPPGLLVHRDPLAVRHLPARAARLEERGTRRRSSSTDDPAAPRAAS